MPGTTVELPGVDVVELGGLVTVLVPGGLVVEPGGVVPVPGDCGSGSVPLQPTKAGAENSIVAATRYDQPYRFMVLFIR